METRITVALVTAIILCITTARIFAKSETQADRTRLTLTLILIPVSAVCIFLAAESWRFLGIWEIPAAIHLLIIILLFLTTYYSISLTFVSFAAYKKKGFSNLKQGSEKGLVRELGEELFLGLVLGLLLGSIEGLIKGPLTESLGMWLGIGMSSGLFWALIKGWAAEFKN